MRVVTQEEMKGIEELASKEFYFDEDKIIENVGIRGADFIEEVILSERSFAEIVVLVGQGHNGSDAMAIARHLSNRGHTVRAFLLFPEEEMKPELVKQKKLAGAFGVKLTDIRKTEELQSYLTQTQEQYLVLDGLLGTGFRTPLSNYFFEMIDIINKYSSIIVSIDIPSGITGTNGEMSGMAINADYTLAIGLPKTGHYIADGAKNSGELVILNAGLPNKLLEGGDKFLLTPEVIQSDYKARDKFAHKTTFGHCLVVGGSHGLTGALQMAAVASIKVGTGLVTAATWSRNYGELVSRIPPEIMTGMIPTPTGKEETESILKHLSRYSSIVVGPGMGRGESTRDTVLEILGHYAGPVVVDADAIKELSFEKDMNIFQTRQAPTILTPHIKEFASFAGITVDEVLQKPIEYLKELVDKTNSCIILKGSCTYIGFPNGEIYINHYPNDGMASGGSGDVLAGMVGGLLAQIPVDKKASHIFMNREKFYEAIRIAVMTHTLAGKYAADAWGARSMTAGSIVENIYMAFKDLDGVDQESEA
jgi:hydroxyethylthiazole kinase-like uncharacterized protein yjeF